MPRRGLKKKDISIEDKLKKVKNNLVKFKKGKRY